MCKQLSYPLVMEAPRQMLTKLSWILSISILNYPISINHSEPMSKLECFLILWTTNESDALQISIELKCECVELCITHILLTRYRVDPFTDRRNTLSSDPSLLSTYIIILFKAILWLFQIYYARTHKDDRKRALTQNQNLRNAFRFFVKIVRSCFPDIKFWIVSRRNRRLFEIPGWIVKCFEFQVNLNSIRKLSILTFTMHPFHDRCQFQNLA